MTQIKIPKTRPEIVSVSRLTFTVNAGVNLQFSPLKIYTGHGVVAQLQAQ